MEKRDVPMEMQPLLDTFTAICRSSFPGQLTGVYLHGSMAMGCFHPQTGDIDLIVVLSSPITDEQKLHWLGQVVPLYRKAPPKGLEISLVQQRYCNPFAYPTPFELHISPAHLPSYIASPTGYVKRMKGADPDLAAHITVIRRYGILLYGEEIEKVFAAVPKRDYMSSIWLDVKQAETDILRQPVYVVLNLCRTLAYLQTGLVLSKDAGGGWALRQQMEPAFHTLVRSALRAYRSDGTLTVEEPIARRFAHRMITKIKSRMEQL